MDVDVSENKPPGILKKGSQDSKVEVKPETKPTASLVAETFVVPTEKLGGYTFLIRGMQCRVVEEGDPFVVSEGVLKAQRSAQGVLRLVLRKVPRTMRLMSRLRFRQVGLQKLRKNRTMMEKRTLRLSLGLELHLSIFAGVTSPILRRVCLPCARAAGRVPARKLKHPARKTQVGEDFAFVGAVRIMVLVVCFTGMLMPFPWDGVDKMDNVWRLNQGLRELGIMGKYICVSCDGESSVARAFRAATKLGTGIEFRVSALGRSQSNG